MEWVNLRNLTCCLLKLILMDASSHISPIRFFFLVLVVALIPFGMNAQTAFIGMNQYAFQYQPSGAPTQVGLFFNSTDSRFEFRDLTGGAELSVNPISRISNFRGKLGVNAPSPVSSFQVIGNSRLGSAANYAEVDGSGNLRFYGTSRYIVPGNTYAFQALSSTIGLYFNQTLNQFEFINAGGTPALTLGAAGAGVGNLSLTGEILSGATAGQAKINAVSSTSGLQAAIRGRGVNDFTGGYLGVLGSSSFDGSGLSIGGDEIGVLGISAGTTSSATDNYGLYGYSDNVGVRGLNTGGNFAELGRSDFALFAMGPSRLVGTLTADAVEMTTVLVRNGLDPAPGVDGPLLVGTESGFRLSLFESAIQTANALGASTLEINPFGGNVNIGQGGGLVNIASTGAGNVAVATGGGNANISNILYTDFASGRAGIRDITPEYTLTVRHPTGSLTRNGLAIVNEINNTTWHFYSFIDGDLGFFNSDSLKGLFDNVSGMYMSTSDLRLKNNVRSLGSVTERLLQLQPRQYAFRNDQEQHQYYGFVAQELEEVFPELVHQDGETGLRTVSYTELIPLSVAAIQEEHKLNQDQHAELDLLHTELSKALERIELLESAMTACCQASGAIPSAPREPNTGTTGLLEGAASIGQNIPNPSNASTEIPYFLPAGSGQAEIRVMDLNGRILQRWLVDGPGVSSVSLNHQGWASGIYLYGLFMDGRPVQTREMQLQ